MSYDWDELQHRRTQTALDATFWRGVIFGAVIEALLVLFVAWLIWAV